MPSSARPPAILSRRTTLALLAGALLARPGAARAREFKHDYWFSIPAVPGGGSLRLRLRVAADGSAEARGAVHLPGTDPPAVLVATGEADAVFAGDGLAGLTVLLRRPSSPASCCHVAGDISFDAPVGPSGTYAADVAFVDRDTGETLYASSIELAVKALDGRTPRATGRSTRRKAGKGKRGRRQR